MEKEVILKVKVDKAAPEQSAKSIKQELRLATEEAIKLGQKFGESSKEYTEAAKKVARLKDVMGDFKQKVDALNPDKFARFSSGVNGITRGFQAAQGAAVLFGTQSEQLEKSLQKLMAIMAFADGIQGVLDASKAFGGLKGVVTGLVGSFKSLKAAIAATGLGLIVVALGTIVAYWDDIKEAITGVNGETEKNSKLLDAQIEKSNELLATHKSSHEIQKLRGKTEKEILLDEIKLTDELIKQQKAKLENLKIAQAEAVASRQKLYDTFGGRIKVFGFDTPEAIKREGDKLIKEQEKVLLALTENRAKAANQITEIDRTAEEKRIADYKKTQEQIIADKNEANDEIIANYRKQKEKERKAAEELTEKVLEEAKKREEELKASEDRVIGDIILFYDKQKVIAGNNQAQITEIEIAKQQAIINSTKAGSKEQVDALLALAALKKGISDKELADLKASEEAKTAIRMAGLEALSNIGKSLQSLSGKNKALAKIGLLVEEATGIAKIIINTASANAKAVAAFPLTGGQPFVAINVASAALGIAASVKATRDAMKQLGGGSGSGGGSASELAINGGKSQTAASGFTKIQGANSQKQPEIQAKTPPVKVYVVQKEIKEATETAGKLYSKAVIK